MKTQNEDTGMILLLIVILVPFIRDAIESYSNGEIAMLCLLLVVIIGVSSIVVAAILDFLKDKKNHKN